MTIGKRITLGFLAVVVTLGSVAGLAAWNMKTAASRADGIANEAVPESIVGARIAQNQGEIRASMRGFDSNFEERFSTQAKKDLAELKGDLAEGRALVAKHPVLVKLGENVGKVEALVTDFEKVLLRNEVTGLSILRSRDIMLKTATEFVDIITGIFDEQAKLLTDEIARGGLEPAKLAERARKTILAGKIRNHGNLARVANFRAQAIRDPKVFEVAVTELAAAGKSLDELAPLITQPAHVAQIQACKKALSLYLDTMEVTRSAYLDMVKTTQQRVELGDKVTAIAQEIADGSRQRANLAASLSSTSLGHSTTVVVFGIIAGLSIAVALSFFITRSTTKALTFIASTLNEGASQISAASNHVSSSSQSLAEAASEQAASIEETSASLEEISAMTKRNAEHATASRGLSQQANQSAATGLQRLGEMNHTLTTVKAAVGDMESAVQQMQSSSQEISKIIKTIDEIAFQTNLLALNAAVEAARAGEAGMGFAVVADEVRSLAQRSAQAAKETSEKIEAAIKRSESGGVASKKVVQALTEMETSAGNIAQVFNGIVTQVKALDEGIGEITVAGTEQSRGIGEINMAVSQMDKVTQSNAATAEECASSSEELNAQVSTLQAAVISLTQLVGGSGAAIAPAAPVPVVASRKPAVAARPVKAPAYNGHPPTKGYAATNGHAPSNRFPMPDLAGAGSRNGDFKNF